MEAGERQSFSLAVDREDVRQDIEIACKEK